MSEDLYVEPYKVTYYIIFPTSMINKPSAGHFLRTRLTEIDGRFSSAQTENTRVKTENRLEKTENGSEIGK